MKSLLWFYFMLGFTFAFPGLSMQTHLISAYDVSPAEITAWFGVVSLPWFFKPIYGIISDSCPLRCCTSKRFHRRPYITIGLLSTSLAWMFMCIFYESMGISSTMGIVALQSLFLCISDVAADGLMVAAVKTEKETHHGRLQTYVWSLRTIGGIVATYIGMVFQRTYGTRAVYAASALLPFITSIVIWNCSEEPAKIQEEIVGCLENLKKTCKGVWNTLDEAKYLVLFCFVFSATPSYGSTLFIFLQTKLKYSLSRLAKLDIFSSFFGLFGTLFSHSVMKRINPKWAIFWGVVCSAAVRCSLLIVVDDPNWSLRNPLSLGLLYAENSAMAFLTQITQMPLLIMAAHACKAPFEAACYATVLSVSNFGGATSSFFGASLTNHLHITSSPENWKGLPTLIELCTGSMIIPLIFLFALPIKFSISNKERVDAAEAKGNKVTPIDSTHNPLYHEVASFPHNQPITILSDSEYEDAL
jgi:Na+/melibiose symporter-like transporter